jgi:hypothetical protein
MSSRSCLSLKKASAFQSSFAYQVFSQDVCRLSSSATDVAKAGGEAYGSSQKL